MMNKERKLILIVGAVVLLVGALYRFAPSMGGWLPDDASIEIKRQQIAKFQNKIASEKRLQRERVALSRQLERAERLFLDGTTPALAAVHIQNIINEIANNNDLKIDSLTVQKATPLEDEGIEGIIEVPVQVRTRGTIRQLANLLSKLESGPQLLTVTELQIRRMLRGGDEMLNVYLTVAGYMKEQ